MGDRNTGPAAEDGGRPRLKGKAYEKELHRLQVELCHLQDWLKATGQRVVVVLEGRDAAGKGGAIKAITERVSPRVFRVVALPAPSDREKTQLYMQRYLAHFPAAGEAVIFDRSWYNRAGVEYVLGFCTKEQTRKFLEVCPAWERQLVESGIRLVKYWLEVRLLPGAGQDDGGHGHRGLALARGQVRRQEARPPQPDRALPVAVPLRAHRADEDQAGVPLEQAGLRRRSPHAPAPLDPPGVLSLIRRSRPRPGPGPART
jgi:hypothetical protein